MLSLHGDKTKICLLIFISYIKIIYQEILVCAFLSKMFKGQVSVCNGILSIIASVCVCVCENETTLEVIWVTPPPAGFLKQRHICFYIVFTAVVEHY